MPEREGARQAAVKVAFLQKVGERGLKGWESALQMLTFLGENLVALGNLLRRRAQFRWADAFLVMEECGPQALGIVALMDTRGQGTLTVQWRITAPGSDALLKKDQTRLDRTGASPHGHPEVIATTLSDLVAEFSRVVAQSIRQSAQSGR